MTADYSVVREGAVPERLPRWQQGAGEWSRGMIPGAVSSLGLGKFDPIAEGIFRESALAALELNRVNHHAKPIRFEIFCDCLEVVHHEGGMSFLGRTEVIFHAKVQLLSSALEPQASSRRQRLRLRDLSQSQDASVEGSRCGFFATRHCDLQVI